jgi:hypothetical protein
LHIATLKHCPALARAPFSNHNAAMIRALGAHCPLLECLEIDDTFGPNIVKEKDLIDLFAGCRQLSEFDWYYMTAGTFTDACLLSLAVNCVPGRRLKKMLVHSDTHGFPGLTDVGVVTIARACPRLTHFELENAVDVADESVLALAEHCRLLQSVRIRLDCYGNVGRRRAKLTDTSIVTLAQRCLSLSDISFTDSLHVTDSSLFALAKGCPNLERVSFSRTAVLDAGVVELARRCNALTSVAVNSTSITDYAVIQLLEHCPNLWELGISFCDELTDNTIHNLIHVDKHLAVCCDYFNPTDETWESNPFSIGAFELLM